MFGKKMIIGMMKGPDDKLDDAGVLLRNLKEAGYEAARCVARECV